MRQRSSIGTRVPDVPVSSSGSIMGNTLMVMIANVLATVSGFFVSVLLARGLGVEGFGLLTFALTFVAFCEVPAVFGTSTVITRELSVLTGTSASRFLRNAIVLRVALMLLAGLGGAVLALVLYGRHSRHTELLAVILWSLLGLAGTLRGVYASVLRAYERAGWSALVGLGRAVLYASLVLAIVTAGGGVRDVVRAGVLATLVALWVDRTLSRRFVTAARDLDPARMALIMRLSWPLALSSVLTIVQVRLDILMLQWISGSETVGVYGAAVRLTEGLHIVPSALMVSSFPLLVRAFENDQKQLRVAFRALWILLLMVALPCAAVAAPQSGEIIVALYGTRFADSGAVLSVFLWQVPLGFLNGLLVNVLFAARRQKLEVWASVLTTLTNAAGNVLLIPGHGALGAAWATLGGQVVAMICLLTMTVRATGVAVPWKATLRLLTIGGTCLVVGRWSGAHMHWIGRFALAGSVYLALGALAVGREAKQIMAEWVRGRW